jgi:hypothetical protein
VLSIIVLLASAEAKDEEFLLGDLGVKIDPAGWHMDRWSDWDFRATSADGTVILGVWATPLQTPIGSDAAAWGPAIEAKLVEFGARDPKIGGTRVDAGPPPTARVEYTFDLPGGAKGVAFAATREIAGQDLQLVAMTRAPTGARAKTLLESTLAKLEMRKPPLPAPKGPLEVGGHAIPAPEGWRKPLEAEADTVLAEVTAIGGEELTGCGWLFHPVPGQKPGILLVCPSRQHFGVLDALTVDDVAAEVAPHLFGKAAPPPASFLQLPDRGALVWKVPVAGKGLRMALVPVGTTAMRVWAAAPADDAALDAALKDALTGATWAAPHELVWTEQASYYLNYQPLSPQVLCPVTGVLCPLGLLAAAGTAGGLAWSRRKKKATDDLN